MATGGAELWSDRVRVDGRLVEECPRSWEGDGVLMSVALTMHAARAAAAHDSAPSTAPASIAVVVPGVRLRWSLVAAVRTAVAVAVVHTAVPTLGCGTAAAGVLSGN